MALKAEAEEENNRFWKEKHLGFINKVARAYNPSELTETQYDFVEKQNELFNSRPKER
jgi:regulation of enolase protein 1 (concanavalin A-like superfamily)